MPRAAAKSPTAERRKSAGAAGAAAPRSSRRPIDLGVLDGLIGFNLRQAQDAAFRSFVRLSSHKDFKAGRFAALMLLHYNPGLSQTDLCRELSRDKSTVTPLVQELLRRGLIARKTSEADRRSVTMTLTDAGQAYLDSLLADVHEHGRRLDAIVGKDKAQLLRLLKKIAAELG
jgi:DNA-binding MarR family transcriptional regulator